VPLHWNHQADDIVGYVAPDSMVESSAGLKVRGKVDLDTERGRTVWRLVKANTVGFSFGYMPTKSRKRSDGGRELLELDIFEISITPSPMNNRTRVLSTKSLDIAPELIGTAWDPLMATDEDPAVLIAEGKKVLVARQKAMRPIQIATFEC
jgi:hypothetical protein